MKTLLKTLSISALLLTAPTAGAFAADAVFSGVVASSCVLTVGTPGVMTSNGSNTILSSEQAGGVKSTVVAAATGATFSISATAPSAFTLAPPNGGDNVTFGADYNLTGATIANDILAGVATPLSIGLSTMEVDLAATKSVGIFPTGAYNAAVLITCE